MSNLEILLKYFQKNCHLNLKIQSFSIPCVIGSETIEKVMCDVEENVSLIPLSLGERLGIRQRNLLIVKLMTLNERSVGGNPQVLLLLFCLLFVILSCFVGNCPRMIQRNGKKLSLGEQNLGTARACSAHLQTQQLTPCLQALVQYTRVYNSIKVLSMYHKRYKKGSQISELNLNQTIQEYNTQRLKTLKL